MKQHTTDRMAELEWNFMHAPECPDSYDSCEDCGDDYDKFIAEHFAEYLDENVEDEGLIIWDPLEEENPERPYEWEDCWVDKNGVPRAPWEVVDDDLD